MMPINIIPLGTMNLKLKKAIQQQIIDLLLSAEDTKLSTAIEIIETNEATLLFEIELFLAYQYSEDQKNKNSILSLIKKTKHTKLQTLFNKEYNFKTASDKKVNEYINTITIENDFDKNIFAFTLFKITKNKAIDYILENGSTEQRIEVLKVLMKNKAIHKKAIDFLLEYGSIDQRTEVLNSLEKNTNIHEKAIDFLLEYGSTEQRITALNTLKTEDALIIKSDKITQLPKELIRFTGLKHLQVCCTKIKEFPMVLTAMQHLESLNLSGTRLNKLPKDIEKLKSLKKIDLTSCNFKKFPKEIYPLENLEELALGSYGHPGSQIIPEIPKGISALKKLKKINLESNTIKHFPDTFFQLKALVELNIRSNPITTIPDAISTFSNLEKINIGYTGFRTLPTTLTQLKKLKELDISYCGNSYEFDSSVLLVKIPSLEKLTISKEHFNSFKQLYRLTFLKQLTIKLGYPQNEGEWCKAAKKILPNCNIIVE